MFRKKIIGYVSEIDKFLDDFNKTHPKSESQVAEIKKYERIYLLRDKPTIGKEETLWSEF